MLSALTGKSDTDAGASGWFAGGDKIVHSLLLANPRKLLMRSRCESEGKKNLGKKHNLPRWMI
jgi:hypothetical protein